MQHPPHIHESTVIKAGQGERSAQADLYRYYGKAMYNICIRMTGSAADAQDVFQDAFIDAFRHLGQLKQPGAFAGWLRRIMINKCIQFSRSHVRWSSLDEEGSEPAADHETAWWLNIPLDLVQEEIKNLPGGCREVFVLYALEDFPHKEIAGNLGISESTSKSQYQRARKLLRDRITKQMHLNG
ncbi:MAG: RNA polymerase sigma factor [Bacteroidota bacterium]|nr:RNA polymerase sigma factor [Bacteroidota bacterium]MDP4218436.1 RNA polymerase sigma factor [Bacteroidota bacterium]MDP4247577.1 RNA polymerase sigma factor [Bacteroidota bacterium]MDP4255519.1 RNA polymerase sigma factor [Bacteroidota bacterium]